MKPEDFKSEADLCTAFIAWADKQGVTCYAEWWGWDILVVYPDGRQLGIQAKLRLNAEVILQAAPDRWYWTDSSYTHENQGPDYRGLLVPKVNPLAGVARLLGLVVFEPFEAGYPKHRIEFSPGLDGANRVGDPWMDWNPSTRHELPPVPTDAVAGSPCPVTLTPWKLRALAVLAELEVVGTITTRRMKDLKVDPSRWLSGLWLMPGETRGQWVRGERCPKFDEQHPAAYALALEKARTLPGPAHTLKPKENPAA